MAYYNNDRRDNYNNRDYDDRNRGYNRDRDYDRGGRNDRRDYDRGRDDRRDFNDNRNRPFAINEPVRHKATGFRLIVISYGREQIECRKPNLESEYFYEYELEPWTGKSEIDPDAESQMKMFNNVVV